MKSGLVWVLHAHMPWVRAGPTEACWLTEAVDGCYLRLLEVLEQASQPFHLSISLSPPLIRQLESINPAIARRFAALAEKGEITLFTTAATHGFLPLLHALPGAVDLQLDTARQIFESTFQRPPAGLWLPECGYQPGLDAAVVSRGFQFAFVEDHAFFDAVPVPKSGIRAPAKTPAGLTLFARDSKVSAWVWSRQHGYPAHADYLDFHQRKNGQRFARVGGGAWNEQAARQRARVDAADFVQKLEADCEREPGLRVVAFDAELFGHWWFEGPWFLAAVLEAIARSKLIHWESPVAAAATAQDTIVPGLSSWGRGGYSAVWVNERNAWLWPLLARATERLQRMLRERPEASELEQRAMTQALTQVLLAQASDWPFLLDAQTSVDVATRRLETHLGQAQMLFDQLQEHSVDAAFVEKLEARDSLLESAPR